MDKAEQSDLTPDLTPEQAELLRVIKENCQPLALGNGVLLIKEGAVDHEVASMLATLFQQPTIFVKDFNDFQKMDREMIRQVLKDLDEKAANDAGIITKV